MYTCILHIVQNAKITALLGILGFLDANSVGSGLKV